MFKIVTMAAWIRDIEDNISRVNRIDILYGPALNEKDPREFCKHFQFENIYETNVFVCNHEEDNCYWWIDGDETTLIYKPKLH